jgi:thermostable 8-oxoguanine DNA glycosylase
MTGRHTAVLISAALVTSAPVIASDLDSSAFTPRQMAHCIMKRVRTNTAESYRDAFKECKTQFAAVRSDRPPEAEETAATLPEKPKQ